ncbi:Putative monoglyceride [Sparassis crispa]|uniref:Monoglyceride n=1 Tax=Sparassis crispa TaxID=139825 RepID=A0A401GF79_9APHY|nr:Putative monoglyceride [Sparassis crispa]GBE80781.1 Putative monoglyceride [Sparassis crispa]
MSDTPVVTEAWLPGFDGHQFYTRTYPAADSSAPRGVILFVHGFAEYTARYAHVHRIWAARGYTLFTYDQRGFGQTAVDLEHRSKGSAYGKTCLRDQLSDVQWWVQYLKGQYPDSPLFLMGHSMGGALSLAFATRVKAPPSPETVQMLSGIIASSPFLEQTTPVSRLLRWVGEKAAMVLPHMPFPAEVLPEHLSHDPVVNEAAANDPLLKQRGTLRGLADMLNLGEQLLWNDYKRWPKQIPLLILHGTDDKIASCKAVEEFYGKLDAEDKKISLYSDGYHELANEPDGVKEKFVDECIEWVEARLSRRLGEVPEASNIPVSRL